MRLFWRMTVRAFTECIQSTFYICTTLVTILSLSGALYWAVRYGIVKPIPLDVKEYSLSLVIMGILLVGIIGCGAGLGKSILHDRIRHRGIELIERRDYGICLLGKMTGFGAAGCVQLFLYMLLTIVVLNYYDVQGVMLYTNIWINLSYLTPTFSVYLVLFFILGFLQYASLYIAAGSLLSKTYACLASIIVLLLFAVVIFLFLGVPPGQFDFVMKVVSLIPYVTPFLMIMRLTTEHVGCFQVILRVMIMVGAIWINTYITLRIYEVGFRNKKDFRG